MLPTGNLKVLWEWSEWLAWAINIVDCKSVIVSRLAHNWIEYIWDKLVGCEAVFAGKPAPTF
ncbi:hypothetical protein D3C86_2068690 [compost metagenome]